LTCTQLPIVTNPDEYLQINSSYKLLLWRANNTNAESFKIKWKQRSKIKMCISLSYLLEDESKCTFSMDLIDDDSLYKHVIYSNNIQESVTWFYYIYPPTLFNMTYIGNILY